MGGEQAAKTMAIVTKASMQRRGVVDQEELDKLQERIIDRFDRQMSVFVTSAHVLDDGVIDPRDTRAILVKVLAVCRDGDARAPPGDPIFCGPTIGRGSVGMNFTHEHE